MVWLENLWYKLTRPYREWKREKEVKKKIEELKKRDPFIYK
jgi:hypothetical protein